MLEPLAIVRLGNLDDALVTLALVADLCEDDRACNSGNRPRYANKERNASNDNDYQRDDEGDYLEDHATEGPVSIEELISMNATAHACSLKNLHILIEATLIQVQRKKDKRQRRKLIEDD